MKLFMDDPQSFTQVPLPAARPRLLKFAELQVTPSCEFEDYCPVALVDRKQLVKASGAYIAEFQGKFYSFETDAAATKFLRRPMRFLQRAKLPAKKPALRGQQNIELMSSLVKSKGLDPAETLTYMQASVAETICQALVESGERRLLCPRKSARESAMLFLAKYMRARNPLNTRMYQATVREELENFLTDCALPQQLKELCSRQELDSLWTSSDAQLHKQCCERFDATFELEF